MHRRERISGKSCPRTREARRVDAVVVRARSGVGLSTGLVRIEVVRVVSRPDARGVVRVLLQLDERRLGRGDGSDGPGGSGILVVRRTRSGAQEVMMVRLQGVPCRHRRGCRGVRPSGTAARSEGAPEIRVIQRGRFVRTRGVETLLEGVMVRDTHWH